MLITRNYVANHFDELQNKRQAEHEISSFNCFRNKNQRAAVFVASVLLS
jgi:hypothetical protein